MRFPKFLFYPGLPMVLFFRKINRKRMHWSPFIVVILFSTIAFSWLGWNLVRDNYQAKQHKQQTTGQVVALSSKPTEKYSAYRSATIKYTAYGNVEQLKTSVPWYDHKKPVRVWYYRSPSGEIIGSTTKPFTDLSVVPLMGLLGFMIGFGWMLYVVECAKRLKPRQKSSPPDDGLKLVPPVAA